MIYTKLLGDDDLDILIQKIFEEEEKVAYLHVRNAEACCFNCKEERSE